MGGDISHTAGVVEITPNYPQRALSVAITGASGGIGYELTRHLAERGVRVYACARTAVEPLVGVESSSIDLRQAGAAKGWAAAISDTTDGIQMLVNNAAVIGQRAPFSEISLETWYDTVQTNLLAVVSVTRAMLPLLERGAPATIVNVGSIMGRFGRAGWSPYVATKFALEGLTQVLAQELFRFGIRVVTLHPARLNTNLRRAAFGEETLFPHEHLTGLFNALDWILDHPLEPLSGLALSTDDFSVWSGAER